MRRPPSERARAPHGALLAGALLGLAALVGSRPATQGADGRPSRGSNALEPAPAPAEAGGSTGAASAGPSLPVPARAPSGAPPLRGAGPPSVALPAPSAAPPGAARRGTIAAMYDAEAAELRELVAADPDDRRAHAAAWVLANRLALDDADADALLARLARCGPEQPDLARALLWALTLRPDRLEVDALRRFTTDRHLPAVRRAAARALARLASDEATALLADLAAADADPRNRGEGALLLGLRTPEGGAADLVERALASEREPRVRRAWVALAGARPGGDALLHAALRDPEEDPSVRALAAELLASRDEGLAAELERDRSLPELVREHAGRLRAAALAEPRRPDATEGLEEHDHE